MFLLCLSVVLAVEVEWKTESVQIWILLAFPCKMCHSLLLPRAFLPWWCITWSLLHATQCYSSHSSALP